VLTGENVLIGGFIVEGNAPKKVLVRAIGPSTGIASALADPVLDLHAPDGSVVTNDNWQDAPNAGDIPPGLQPRDPRESAILITLSPGAYTGVVHGKSGATGIGLVEVYDVSTASSSHVVNISTRGLVQTDDNRLIGGFIIGNGNADTTMDVIVRALGPSLTEAGIVNALADPFLDIRDRNGNSVASNDNWKDDANAARVSESGLPPKDDVESALYLSLPGGEYTAIISGTGGGIGVGLVEVYGMTQGFDVRSESRSP
jgi:hypothetical protein